MQKTKVNKTGNVSFPAEWSVETDELIESYQRKHQYKTKREALRQILREFFNNRVGVKNGKQK